MIKKSIDFLQELKIDFIDIKIIVLCFDKEYSVSELNSEIGLAYKNFLPRIKKLEKNKLIKVYDYGRGKKKKIKAAEDKKVLYFIFGILSLYADKRDLEEDKNLYNSITNFLKKHSKK